MDDLESILESLPDMEIEKIIKNIDDEKDVLILSLLNNERNKKDER